jgi:uncharacterized protein
MVDQGRVDPYEIGLLTAEIQAEKPLIIEAFPGIGLIGNIVGGHIVRELEMKYIGTMVSRFFAPIATLADGIVQPPIKIYESKDDGLLVIYSDIPVNPLISFDLAKAVTDFAVDVEASEIISIAGILTMSDEDRVFGAATNETMLNKLSEHTEIFKVGTISGLSGSVMVECFIKNLPAISLIGETHSQGPDPLAASRVIETINRIYGLEIDVAPLLEEATRIESEMEHLASQMKVEEQLPLKEFPMYG